MSAELGALVITEAELIEKIGKNQKKRIITEE